MQTHPSINMIFFFKDTATTEIYPLSLHDALPICIDGQPHGGVGLRARVLRDALLLQVADDLAEEGIPQDSRTETYARSEEHTSELPSHSELVCRLLLEKKKK